ncbi:hypothetical protein GCM10011491_05540 [Brucella endophytica]|uniref:Uncharacterized protein n=1 Tax=Brucella endophytica TaxID=1963359 RepID=A0A916S577_9HYPH|nr:hypothetical protein [Brucella endophytica]GGA81139.1 hypothetical protein GCM10011491_05540 [Brucella endophytica]
MPNTLIPAAAEGLPKDTRSTENSAALIGRMTAEFGRALSDTEVEILTIWAGYTPEEKEEALNLLAERFPHLLPRRAAALSDGDGEDGQ